MAESKKILVSKDKLLEAGVYFGHKKSTWNPKMKPYIARTQKGTHIINIEKTYRTLEFAFGLIKNYAERGASFVFVGTRKQAKATIKENALRTNSFYVDERWLGGTLTNSRTIFQRVKRMGYLEKIQANKYEVYTKKEGLLFDKELAKLHKNLQGIRNMRRKPNVLIIADPSHDDIAIKEAKRLGVKTIGIVDTNNDPSLVDIAIPANDDSVKSVTLIITLLADAIASAKGGDLKFAFKKDSEIELPEEPKREFKPRNRFNNQRRNFGDRNFSKTNSKVRPSETKFSREVNKEKVSIERKAISKPTTNDLTSKTLAELKVLAEAKQIKDFSTLKKDELIKALS